ncbi:MAG: metallophosphoesterase [bacterium]|nr:metallophosphoesterase [bacterium]
MKILLVSDTHIPERASELPPAFVDFALVQQPDLVVHLGDYTSLEVYDWFREHFGERFVGVLGNMDDPELEQRVHELETLQLDNLRVLCAHGHQVPRGDLDALAALARRHGASVLFTGHTHIPLAREHAGIIIINPGSLTNGAIRGAPDCFAVIEISNGRLEVRHYNSESLELLSSAVFQL